MPLPLLPQQPAVRSAGPARSAQRILLFDSDACPSGTGRFAASRPLEKEARF